MKISLRWLKDYVRLPKTEEELARKLTMAGLEVELVHRPGEALRGVVVARVDEATRHPNADKLQVTRVNAGPLGVLQVVCGATNFKVGDKVPLATVGTELPNGVKIGKGNLRGVDSHGMLCSAKELGLAEDASGLLILDANAELGAPIAQALGVDDTVFELNVTPNRADALSHLGVAREVSALTGEALQLPKAALQEAGPAVSERVRVRIDAPDRCPRYAARVVEGVKVGPSPAWLQQRLKACGVRAINNVVDVTNYVLLEYGHPMHGFDLDKVAGHEIVVRLPSKGERLTTLDGKERELHAEDLVIADRDRAVALAGVMGGASSEVSETTTRVLLEAAYFQPSGVRRTSKRHALHTEASHRFERGTDVSVLQAVLDRAAALIVELGGGTVRQGTVDVYPAPLEQRRVTLAFARVGALLGTEVKAEESRAILERLGFAVEKADAGSATFRVPFARVDVELAEDLIEEVARIRGYDTIPPAPHRPLVMPAPEPKAVEVQRRARLALAAAGFDEVLNYAFVSPLELERLGQPAQLELTNPLSADQSVLRTTLLAGLLQNVSRNVRHQVDSARLYEMGRVFFSRPGPHALEAPAAQEELRVAGIAYGKRHGQSWALPKAEVDFYDVKGAVEALLQGLGVKGAQFALAGKDCPATLHPREAAGLRVGGKAVGFLGRLHPTVVKALDLPGAPYVFDLSFQALVDAAELVPAAQPMQRFPAVLRDVAVVVDGGVQAEDVERLLRRVGGELVESVTLFDVYTGKPIPEGRKSLAFSLRYRAKDRTLKDAEVNASHQRIVDEVQRELGGSLRE